MVSLSRRALAPAITSVLLFAGAPARAQASGNTATAERLFMEARAAMDRGDYATACPKLAESLRLVERAGTLLNLAECAAHDRHPIEARARLDRALELLPPGDERVGFAKKRRGEIEAQIARLSIKLDAGFGPEAKVAIDDKAVAASALAEVPIDPGAHVIAVTAPNAARVTVNVTLAAGQRKTIIVDKPAGAVDEPGAASSGSGRRTAGFVVLGVGLAGGVAAGITGGLIVARKSSIDAECPDKRCSAEGRRLIDGTGGLMIANGVAWGVGLAGVAAGTVLILTAPRGPETRVSFTPSPFGAGVSVERSF